MLQKNLRKSSSSQMNSTSLLEAGTWNFYHCWGCCGTGTTNRLIISSDLKTPNPSPFANLLLLSLAATPTPVSLKLFRHNLLVKVFSRASFLSTVNRVVKRLLFRVCRARTSNGKSLTAFTKLRKEL